MSEAMIIKSTMDYDIFKRLTGNRQVREYKVKKLIEKIQEVGAVPLPIVVNEKMEVVDGQNRLEALRRLGLPVYYEVVPNIGIKECRVMNMDQTNWGLMDWVESYAADGIESYKMLIALIKKYGDIGISAIYAAVTGLMGLANTTIKSGRFECTYEQYLEADKILEYEHSLSHVIKKLPGRRDLFYVALGFCYKHPDINNAILKERIEASYKQIQAAANLENVLNEYSEIYNTKRRGGRVYLWTDYQKQMENKYGWYRERYGEKRDYLGTSDTAI